MALQRSNYESWFLDYHEGTLPAEKEAELFAFLDANPDLKEEFRAFELIRLQDDQPADAPSFDKSRVKKILTIDESNIDEWLISEQEGQLTPEEVHVLAAYLTQHPARKADRDHYASIRLKAAPENNPSTPLLYALEPIGTHNLDHWLIAESEAQLNAQQLQLLQAYLNSHPDAQRHRAAYASVRLQATDEIIFPARATLYQRNTPVRRLFVHRGFTARTFIRVAAMLLLIAGSWLTVRMYLQPSGNEKQYVLQIPAAPQKIAEESTTTTETPAGMPAVLATNDNAVPTDSTPAVMPAERDVNKLQRPRKTERRRNPVLRQTPKVPATMPRQMAAMPVKDTEALYIPDNSMFAERRHTPFATESDHASTTLPPLQTRPEQNHDATAENDELLTASTSTRLTTGSRLIRFAGKAIGKITGEKVKVRTAFNPVNGRLSAYEVETKKRTWQRHLNREFVSAE